MLERCSSPSFGDERRVWEMRRRVEQDLVGWTSIKMIEQDSDVVVGKIVPGRNPERWGAGVTWLSSRRVITP